MTTGIKIRGYSGALFGNLTTQAVAGSSTSLDDTLPFRGGVRPKKKKKKKKKKPSRGGSRIDFFSSGVVVKKKKKIDLFSGGAATKDDNKVIKVSTSTSEKPPILLLPDGGLAVRPKKKGKKPPLTRPRVTIPPLVYIQPKNSGNNPHSDSSNTLPRVRSFKRPLELNGISNQRPEIISMTDFQPIFTQGRLNNVGEALELQFQVRRLKLDKMTELLEALEGTGDAKVILNEIKDEYLEQIKLAREDVNFLSSVQETLNRGKRALDIKSHGETRQTTKGIKVKSFRDILVNEFGFSDEGYNQFTHTKIFGQFIKDFGTTISQYSPSLFDTIDSERQADVNPTEYAEDIDVTDGKFRFKIENFRSRGGRKLQNMGATRNFAKFITSLPTDSDDRAKLLTVSLSKEMRVSQGLSNSSTQNLIADNFLVEGNSFESGNPFDNIIGNLGSSISDPLSAKKSLASLTQENDTDRRSRDRKGVLPFEKGFIEASDKRIYIPGKKFLIDSITSGENAFNTDNLTAYSDRFEDITRNSVTVINSLLNLKDRKRILFCDNLYKDIINDIVNISLPAVESQKQYPNFIPIALLRTANSDLKLKEMLFQYTVLLGMQGNGVGDEASVSAAEEFFENLSEAEMNTMSDFSQMRFPKKKIKFSGGGASGGNLAGPGADTGSSTSSNINNFSFGTPRTAASNINNWGFGTPKTEPVDIPWGYPTEAIKINEDTATNNTLFVRTAIESMRKRIVQRVFRIVSRGAQSKSARELTISKKDLNSFLSENDKFFKMISVFMGSLDVKTDSISKTSNSGDYFSDGSFRSRYNSLTGSTRVLMVFEIYSAIATKYLDVSFSASSKRQTIILNVVHDNIVDITDAMQEIFGDTVSKTGQGINNIIKRYTGANSNKKANNNSLNFSGGNPGATVVPKIYSDDPPPSSRRRPSNVNTSATTDDPKGPTALSHPIDRPIRKKVLVLISALQDIKDKLVFEDDFLIEVTSRLEDTSSRINDSLQEVEQFFDFSGPNGPKFRDLMADPDANEKIPLMSKSQLRLAQKELLELEGYNALSFRKKEPYAPYVRFLKWAKSQASAKTGGSNASGGKSRAVSTSNKSQKTLTYPVFFDGSDIPDFTQSMLRDLLSKSEFKTRKGTNMKILSVGIPEGFSEGLNAIGGVNNFEQAGIFDKEKDVININVYRKDLEFEEIVFKPQTFIFEMSRFVSRSTFTNNVVKPRTANFDLFDDAFVLMRDIGDDFNQSIVGESKDIRKDEKYSFLDHGESRDLIKNHIVSYLLEVYLKILTGISHEEGSFLLNRSFQNADVDEKAKKRFKNLMEIYVSNIAGRSITLDELKESSDLIAGLLNKIDNLGTSQSFSEQINPPNLPSVSRSASVELTEDLISFLNIFKPSNILMGGFTHRKRITSPKAFERIFNIAVDPDDFIIDVEKTNLTNSGRRAIQHLRGRKIIKIKNSQGDLEVVRNKTQDDIQLDQFFITISTVGDFVI